MIKIMIMIIIIVKIKMMIKIIIIIVIMINIMIMIIKKIEIIKLIMKIIMMIIIMIMMKKIGIVKIYMNKLEGEGMQLDPHHLIEVIEAPAIKLQILTSRKRQFQQQEKKQVLAWKGFMLQLMLFIH